MLQDLAADTPPAELLVRHGERLVPMVAQLTGQSREWVEALPLDEAVELLGTLIEVNADFFTQRLRPVIQKRMTALTQTLGSQTPTPLPTASSS